MEKMRTKEIPQLPSFDLQGHRGCRGLMPENTIPAMMKALDLGVTTLEMDVVITKDSQVILSHDPYFNHEITTKPDGSLVSEKEEKELNIYKMTYNEVLQFDVGMRRHPRFPEQQKIKATKPLLNTVIDSVENYITSKGIDPIFYNIETKCTPYTDRLYHPEPFQFIELLMEIINEKKLHKRVIIQSFDIRTLQYLHEHYPAIKTSLLIEDFDKRGVKDHLRVLGFLPDIYSPHYSLVSDSLVNHCHEKSVKVIPWTVNELDTMVKLKAIGVDGIISDYRNLFKELKN
jgi:glycerophosphoryl diester phosphodiesterase